MFRFIKRYRLFFDMLAFIVFALGSYFYFMDYFDGEFYSSKDKKMKLVGAIVFGIMALIKLSDSYEGLKNKKTNTIK